MLFKSKHQETRFMRIPSLVITWGWDFSSAWLAPRNPVAGSCSLSNHFKPRISVDRNGRNWLTWTKKMRKWSPQYTCVFENRACKIHEWGKTWKDLWSLMVQAHYWTRSSDKTQQNHLWAPNVQIADLISPVRCNRAGSSGLDHFKIKIATVIYHNLIQMVQPLSSSR